MPVTRAAAALLVVALATGCGQGAPEPGTDSSRAATPTTSTATSSTPSPPGPTASPTREADRFRSAVRRLTADERAAMVGVSWHEGCPVPLERLRHVSVTHLDFSGRRRTGVLVVRADVAADVVAVFERLHELEFPVRRIRPIEAYDGDDFASIEADNTSAFNCRPATGSDEWSHHAYGVAVDLNPLENPYVFDGGRTSHARSVPYLDRTRERPGMLLPDGPAVAAFERRGWHWGGRWTEPVDLQHFSALPGQPST